MRVFVYITAPLLLILVIAVGWKFLHQRSFRIAEQVELLATYDRWVEAGRPEGAGLEAFLSGRGTDLLIDTGHFKTGRDSFVGILARTNLVSVPNGKLVITTNRVVLLVPDRGRVRVVSVHSLY
jgi:hypothetical protein